MTSTTSPPVHLEQVNDGVAAVAALLGEYLNPDGQLEEAFARWDAFEARVRRLDTTPLGQLVLRFRLGTFDLRVLVLALAAQIEPKLKRLVLEARTDALSRGVTVHLAIDLFGRTASERYVARLAFLATGPLVKNRLITLSASDLENPDDLLASRIEIATPDAPLLAR